MLPGTGRINGFPSAVDAEAMVEEDDRGRPPTFGGYGVWTGEIILRRGKAWLSDQASASSLAVQYIKTPLN